MRRDLPLPTVRARVRRLLDLPPASHPRGMAHLAAASGLVRVGERLFTVADDELHLAELDARSRAAPIALHRLFRGTLPARKKARKKSKPDLESLLVLDAVDGARPVSLLAMGSGSRPNRRRGARLDLDASGQPVGAARTVDLAPLFEGLRSHVDEPNVEGAFRLGATLRLLHRGNAGDPTNAIVSIGWAAFVDWLEERGPPPKVVRVVRCDLGERDGVPYGFTDGAALDGDTFAFSAAAEATDDAYADGASGGSLVGLAGADGRIRARARIAGDWKAEGIAVRRDPHDGRVLVIDVVTDADDPDRASALLRLRWRPTLRD